MSEHLPSTNYSNNGRALGRPIQHSPPPPPEEGTGGQGVRRAASAVRRFRWLIAILAIVGTIAGVVASNLIRPKYLAESTIWIQIDRGDSRISPIRSGELLQSFAWLDLLRSFAVLDAVVREQRLYLEHDPDDRALMDSFKLAQAFRPGKYRLRVIEGGKRFQLTTDEGSHIQTAKVGEPIGKSIGFDWVPAPRAFGKDRTVKFEVTTPRDAARRLNQQLQTRMTGDGNFLRVEYRKTDDAERVAAILNSVLDRYVEVAADLKRGKLTELAQILEEQRLYAERNLRDAEVALENFRVRTITLPTDDATPVAPGLEATRDPVFGNFFTLKIDREQIRRDAEGIRKALSTRGQAGVALDALATIGSVQRSPELTTAISDLTTKRAELRALQQQYTSQHPNVQRLATEIATQEQQTIPRLATTLLQELETRAGVMDGWISSASGDLRQIPPRMIEEARLRRQVEIAERLHNNLRERYEEARLASETSIPDVRILDRATAPQKPLTNVKVQIILIGAAIGIGLALLLAILLDRLDRRFRYPEQITQGMRLSILGALPDVKAKSRVPGMQTTHAIEALREIRLNLLHSSAPDEAVMLTVSSPGSGDGKTFLSCNLALAFADAGLSTIVVDGDTRRGEMHRLLNATRKPGLTEYLHGEVSASGIIQRTNFPRLDFIATGKRTDAAPNLLGTQPMHELVNYLRTTYKVVIFDSPPLGAGVDAYAMGTLTENMVLVLRSGRTDRTLAEAKLDVLDRLPIRVVGAVINGISSDRGTYRYYSYISGYEVSADDEETPSFSNGKQPRQLEGV